MLEILKYIFSSFWIFCGTVILVGTMSTCIATIIASFRKGG